MAAAVMAFAISSSIVVMQAGFKAIDNARNTTLASQIIQSEMERIRLLNWSDVNALPTTTTPITIPTLFPAETITSKFTETLTSRFSAFLTLTPVPGKESEMRTITIVVTWVGLDGITHTRSTTGTYCKDGLYDYYCTLPA